MRTSTQRSFHALSHVLLAHANLWRERPFFNLSPSWREQLPDLYNALLSLSDEDFTCLSDSDALTLDFLAPYLPQLTLALSEVKTEILPQTDVAKAFSAYDSADIKGRKWLQILAFAGALNAEYPEASLGSQLHPWVDWCAGKGHLARVLNRVFDLPLACLEYDMTLCEAGEQLARKRGADIKFYQQDVKLALPASLIEGRHHTGLHACGDLHLSLLQQAGEITSGRISLSPCCYHKIATPHYQPLSSVAVQVLKDFELTLTHQDLQLAMEETVTGGQREVRLRSRERLWRIAFDLIQRDVLRQDVYLPVPSIKRGLLSEDFQAFCAWAADKKSIKLPSDLSLDSYLQKAEKKKSVIARLELLRQVFRRPLEQWLILDRVLFLESKGFHVKYGTFCEKKLTPRNFLILAEK